MESGQWGVGDDGSCEGTAPSALSKALGLRPALQKMRASSSKENINRNWSERPQPRKRGASRK
eukprot:367472-Rhodomonas_salina.1